MAHSFTTHALDTEVDYFTVVDDLAEDETGAAHANEMELGGGVYYGYIVVDIPLLISNLTGCDITEWESQDKQDAYDLLSLLIHAAAQVTPGAKLRCHGALCASRMRRSGGRCRAAPQLSECILKASVCKGQPCDDHEPIYFCPRELH